MGTKERQERERHRTRQAILDAARDLFVTEGYRNVSMRKIAERIEYSAAAIYSYFPSKDDIFFALAEEGFRLLAERVLATVQHIPDPLARLRAGLLAFYAFSKTNPEYFELMFVDRSVPSLTQDFQRFEFFQQTTARAEADVRACIERGQFSRALEPAAALHVLWVAVLGAATIGLAKRLAPGEDPDALAHDVLEAVLAGFTTVGTTFVAQECPFHAPDGASVPVMKQRDAR
ncbi:MAG: TetR/AcrR family transcriptional regulator [Acidimicrobiia bacterium]|nr:TetR/AcrR family transcriptional regulator [Acidimicrobiia bacterium]